MTATVRDNPEKSRFDIFDDDEHAGFVEYRKKSDNVIVMPHTRVFDEFGGRGLARVLVTEALASVREQGLSVQPVCPYVRKVIAGDPDQYLDLVRPEDRARFDLPA